MYYGSGTVKHTAIQGRHIWQDGGFSRDEVMAAILKVCRHMQNQTMSINAYLRKKITAPNFIPVSE